MTAIACRCKLIRRTSKGQARERIASRGRASGRSANRPSGRLERRGSLPFLAWYVFWFGKCRKFPSDQEIEIHVACNAQAPGERVASPEYKLDFGKYKGLTLAQVVAADSTYLLWCVSNRVQGH